MFSSKLSKLEIIAIKINEIARHLPSFCKRLDEITARQEQLGVMVYNMYSAIFPDKSTTLTAFESNEKHIVVFTTNDLRCFEEFKSIAHNGMETCAEILGDNSTSTLVCQNFRGRYEITKVVENNG